MLGILWARIWITAASIPVMALGCLGIAAVHLLKRFQRLGELEGRDPFHDSRRHPLNSPGAPRG